MREYNILEGYPKPKNPRYVGPKIRTIKNRIIASYRAQGYYDGDRNIGYGGFKYDGRWVSVAKKLPGGAKHKITNSSHDRDIYGLFEKSSIHDNEGEICKMKNILGTFLDKFLYSYRFIPNEDQLSSRISGISLGYIYGNRVWCYQII